MKTPPVPLHKKIFNDYPGFFQLVLQDSNMT